MLIDDFTGYEHLQPRDYVAPMVNRLLIKGLRKAEFIQGGYGTGKTVSLFHVINGLVKAGVDPSRIAFLALTPKCVLSEKVIADFLGFLAYKVDYIIIDEAPYLKSEWNFLTGLVEYTTDCRFVLTGTDTDVMDNIWLYPMFDRGFRTET